jgi:hypothetical protein
MHCRNYSLCTCNIKWRNRKGVILHLSKVAGKNRFTLYLAELQIHVQARCLPSRDFIQILVYCRQMVDMADHPIWHSRHWTCWTSNSILQFKIFGWTRFDILININWPRVVDLVANRRKMCFLIHSQYCPRDRADWINTSTLVFKIIQDI